MVSNESTEREKKKKNCVPKNKSIRLRFWSYHHRHISKIVYKQNDRHPAHCCSVIVGYAGRFHQLNIINSETHKRNERRKWIFRTFFLLLIEMIWTKKKITRADGDTQVSYLIQFFDSVDCSVSCDYRSFNRSHKYIGRNPIETTNINEIKQQQCEQCKRGKKKTTEKKFIRRCRNSANWIIPNVRQNITIW